MAVSSCIVSAQMRVFLLLGPFALAYAILRGDWLALIVWGSIVLVLLAYSTGRAAGQRELGEALDSLFEKASEGSEHVARQRSGGEQ